LAGIPLLAAKPFKCVIEKNGICAMAMVAGLMLFAPLLGGL
jgi:hypothetical protein